MRISISLDTAYPKLRPDKHARGMCIVLTYSYGKFNCDRLHIVIDDFRGACAVKGNVPVAGHVKRVDRGDIFARFCFVRKR